MENTERKEIIIVSLTLFILLFTSMQIFENLNKNNSNLTTGYLQIPYFNLQIPVLMIITSLYGIGIVYLILCYMYTLFDTTTGNDNQVPLQELIKAAINATLIINLMLTAISISLFILHSIFTSHNILLYMALFMMIINVISPILVTILSLLSLRLDLDNALNYFDQRKMEKEQELKKKEQESNEKNQIKFISQKYNVNLEDFFRKYDLYQKRLDFLTSELGPNLEDLDKKYGNIDQQSQKKRVKKENEEITKTESKREGSN